MVSEAKLRANKKYRDTHQDNIVMTVQKEVKARYKAEADKRGLSLSGFIRLCVENYLEADSNTEP